jgi:FkbM family methyltransferase
MGVRTRLVSSSAAFIARRRQSRAVGFLHRAARVIDDAYHNTNMDLATNGESHVMQRLAVASVGVAFDVGAHAGGWSMAALHAWPDATVHAFEVAPPTFADLSRKIAAAGLSSRVRLNELGLSDATGTECLYYFPGSAELTCDRPRHEGRPFETFEGSMLRGDEYVAQTGVRHIDFLKIDVEGAEHKVLRGFSQTIAAGRIECIQFEYGAFAIQTRLLLADYFTLLGEHYWIGKIYPTYVEFSDYAWTLEGFRFANFLAVSRTRSDLRDRLEH